MEGKYEYIAQSKSSSSGFLTQFFFFFLILNVRVVANSKQWVKVKSKYIIAFTLVFECAFTHGDTSTFQR